MQHVQARDKSLDDHPHLPDCAYVQSFMGKDNSKVAVDACDCGRPKQPLLRNQALKTDKYGRLRVMAAEQPKPFARNATERLFDRLKAAQAIEEE